MIEQDDIEYIGEVMQGHTYVKFVEGKGSACSCGLGLRVEKVL
jgi:hypothetical protein